jgi:hypothetical protein
MRGGAAVGHAGALGALGGPHRTVTQIRGAYDPAVNFCEAFPHVARTGVPRPKDGT